MMPIRKPSTEPRAIGIDRLRATPAGSGSSSRSFGAITFAGHAGWLGVARISPSPNRPTATGTMPMPSPSSGMSKRIAEVAGHHVDADGAEQQPERRHQQRARQRGGRHVGEEDEAEHEQRGVFGRPEAQREIGERRREQRQHDHAERAGDERADRGDAQRRAGAALAAPWRSRRCRSSPRRPRPECASGSRWSSRRIASRNRCRPASRSPWWRRARRSAAAGC